MFHTIIKILKQFNQNADGEIMRRPEICIHISSASPANTWINVMIIECLWAEKEIVSKGVSVALCLDK